MAIQDSRNINLDSVIIYFSTTNKILQNFLFNCLQHFISSIPLLLNKTKREHLYKTIKYLLKNTMPN